MRVSSLPKAVTWRKRTGRGSNPRPFGSWANALPLSHTNHWHFMCRYNLLYLNNVILIPFIYLFPVSSSILQNRCVTGGGWSLSRRSHAIGRSRWQRPQSSVTAATRRRIEGDEEKWRLPEQQAHGRTSWLTSAAFIAVRNGKYELI